MTTESAAPAVRHPWNVYLRASEEARRRGDRRTGTDHLVLALLEDSSIEAAWGVSLPQARRALDERDHEALGALGVGSDIDAPALAMRDVPTEPTIRAVMRNDRLRLTPAAKKVLQDAVRPNRHKTQVTAGQVLAQLVVRRPPDPAAVLLAALRVNLAEVLARLDTGSPER